MHSSEAACSAGMGAKIECARGAASAAANGDLMDSFSHLAAGEAVERVEVVTTVGRGSNTRFITRSGKIYTWPSNAVALY